MDRAFSGEHLYSRLDGRRPEGVRIKLSGGDRVRWSLGFDGDELPGKDSLRETVDEVQEVEESSMVVLVEAEGHWRWLGRAEVERRSSCHTGGRRPLVLS